MIIGAGNIAKALTDRDDVLFFASGVSDSTCKDESVFQRERDLLAAMPKDKHIVYFSSLGIYRWTNPYIEHKKRMEGLIKTFDSYTIVRLEVIEWGTNPNTIINFFKRQIKEKKDIVIQDTYRGIISLFEFKYWMSYLVPTGKNEINITGKLYSVNAIFNMIKDGKL